MYLKIHESAQGPIVAVCDKELIGKTFQEGKAYLDLDSYRDFYVGKECLEDRVRNALEDFGSANLVGERAVNVALSMELAAKADVMYINNIPYIQIYRI